MVAPHELASVVRLTAQPQDCDVHPSRSLVAVGLVTGRVQVFDAGSRMSTTTTAPASTAAAAAAAAAPTPPPLPPLVSLRASSSSARAVAFSADGSTLYVGDAEGTLTAVDVATGRASARLPGAGASFTRLVATLLGGGGGASPSASSSSSFLPATSVVSGDESGTVRVWDPRSSEPAFEFAEVHGGEQVSDLVPLPAGAAAGLKSNTSSSSASNSPSTTTGGLVSVGGDGTLALLDFARAGRAGSGKGRGGSGRGGGGGSGGGEGGRGRGGGGAAASRSDPDEDELLCLCFSKNFSTLCAGSAGGVLSLWKPKAAGGLAGCADRLPLPRARAGAKEGGGERPAINSLAPLDGGGGGGGGGNNGGGGSLLLAGCADGKVRVLSVLPNRVLCTLGGAHGDGREVLRVRTGGGGGGGEGGEGGRGGEPTSCFLRVAASVAAPSKSLCLWNCEALMASAAEAATAVAAGVGGKRARRRRAEEEDESSSGDGDDGGEEESDDEEDAAAPKRGKAAASRPGSFFDGIV